MKKHSYLDGEILYKKYFSLGEATGFSKLTNFAISQKMFNEHGYKPTRMGVWKAMWRWASLKENQTVAFDIFSEYVRNYGWMWDTDFSWQKGDTVSSEDWKRFMRHKIRRAYQYDEDEYDRYLDRNGWN